MRFSLFAAGALALPFVIAQTSTVTEAAASTVAADATNADINLFDFETVQLLDSDLDPLNDTLQALFGFGDASSNKKRSSSASCKTAPGDLLWPAPILWKLFDVLVGGSLIKAVPIAAPCHSGPYYVRNALGIYVHPQN